MKNQIIAILGLLISAFIVGCSSTPEARQADLRLLTAGAVNEAIMADKNNHVILQELAASMDVFCGTENVDALAISKLFHQFAGRFKSEKTRTRFLFLSLFVSRISEEINPSDFVTWGKLACSLRDGIRTGLALHEPAK